MKASVFVDLTGRRRKIMFCAGAVLGALAAGYIVALVVGLLGGPQAPGWPFGAEGKHPSGPSPGPRQVAPDVPRTQDGAPGGVPGAPPDVPGAAPGRPGATTAGGAAGQDPTATARSSAPGAPATSRAPSPGTPTPAPTTPTPTPSPGGTGGAAGQ